MWQIPSSQPLLAPGQLHGKLDARRASAAHVVRLGDFLRLTYWGTDDAGYHHLLGAEAPVAQPHAWRPLGVLVSRQEESIHNHHGPSFPMLVPVTDKYWLLYFCCWGKQGGQKLPNTTGVAFSEDAGRTWRYHDANPIFPLDRPYDQQGTGSVWVLYEQGRFRCYYTAIGGYHPKPEGVKTGHGDTIPTIGIALAESRDGLHWDKVGDDLLIKPRGFGVEPYEYIVSKPCIIVTPPGTGPRYTLWVNTFGYAYRVHRLTSDDGLKWDWAPRVGPDGELGHGLPGAYDDHQRSYPTMLELDQTRHCWFTGNGFGTKGLGYAWQPTGH